MAWRRRAQHQLSSAPTWFAPCTTHAGHHGAIGLAGHAHPIPLLSMLVTGRNPSLAGMGLLKCDVSDQHQLAREPAGKAGTLPAVPGSTTSVGQLLFDGETKLDTRPCRWTAGHTVPVTALSLPQVKTLSCTGASSLWASLAAALSTRCKLGWRLGHRLCISPS